MKTEKFIVKPRKDQIVKVYMNSGGQKFGIVKNTVFVES